LVQPSKWLRYFSKSLGTIRARKIADLILLGANPLQNIANIGRIEAVILAGRVYDQIVCEELLEQVLNSNDLKINDWLREVSQ